MPKQATRPLATIQRHKISKFRKIPNMLEGEEESTLKTARNVFLLGFAKKESVPNTPTQNGS